MKFIDVIPILKISLKMTMAINLLGNIHDNCPQFTPYIYCVDDEIV